MPRCPSRVLGTQAMQTLTPDGGGGSPLRGADYGGLLPMRVMLAWAWILKPRLPMEDLLDPKAKTCPQYQARNPVSVLHRRTLKMATVIQKVLRTIRHTQKSALPFQRWTILLFPLTRLACGLYHFYLHLLVRQPIYFSHFDTPVSRSLLSLLLFLCTHLVDYGTWH